MIDTENVTILCQPCLVCRKVGRITLPREAFRNWQNGQMIQWAWPESSPEEREMLINGTHPDCSDKMMEEDE